MKIVRIQTIVPAHPPGLLFVRIETDEGVVGHGDTWHSAQAVRGFIHGAAAQWLLGEDPLAIERHWRRLYDICAKSAGLGAEIRGLSALDIALWDILGQAAGMPLYAVLGGASRDRVRIYNTCAGLLYAQGRGPGYGSSERAGTLDDFWAFLHQPVELAQELLSEGIRAMKIWPFDRFAERHGGLDIDAADLAAGIEPFRLIREATGEAIEIMLEGHGFWALPAAKKIAVAVEPYRPAWLEDLMRADDLDALAVLRGATRIPIIASEYLTTRYAYRNLLERRAADIVMLDPAWCGGITEARKIAALADTYQLPLATHDCSGPFTLLAGVHLCLHAPNAMYQETVRAYIRLLYPKFVTELPAIEHGFFLPPQAPGLGATLQPALLRNPDVSVAESSLT